MKIDRKKFMQRTRDVYRHMTERVYGKGIIRRMRQFPFSLEVFRGFVSDALDGGICPYCGAELTLKNISVDHAIPLSRGGSCERVNMTFTCRGCNRAKGQMTSGEFEHLLSFLIENIPTQKADILGRLKMGGLRFFSRKS